MTSFFRRHWRSVWNGPFYIGPLVQPISLGSALIKVFEVAWRAALISVGVILAIAIGDLSWSLLAPAFAPPPKDQEECKAAASLESDNAVAQADCERQFPAVWHEGGYAIFVPEIFDWIQVSGPQPTKTDYANIRSATAIKLAEEKRRMSAMSKFRVKSYTISCNIDDRYIACYDKNITVNLYNGSDMTVSGLHFSYGIGRGLDCSGSLGKSFDQTMTIPAHSAGSFVYNVKFEDAGPNGVLAGCLRLDSVDRIE